MQNRSLLRSGELARLTGVSTDTLRHYERLKLLPVPRRSSGNYRLYGAEAANRVRLIQGALAIGFTLAELGTILSIRDQGGAPCGQAKRLLEQKLTNMEAQILEMTRLKRHLRGILQDWNKRLFAAPTGEPARLLESLPRSLPNTSASPAKRLIKSGKH